MWETPPIPQLMFLLSLDNGDTSWIILGFTVILVDVEGYKGTLLHVYLGHDGLSHFCDCC